MNFIIGLSDRIHKIIRYVSLGVIEIVLLAYYANIDEKMYEEISKIPDIDDDYSAFKGLSVTGSVFMMITWFGQIVLIFKKIEILLYVILGVNSLAQFFLLVGMGMGVQGRNKIPIQGFDNFNYPIGLWFIQFCLYLLSLVCLYELKNMEVPLNTKVQSVDLTTQNKQGMIVENLDTQQQQQNV
ncbi:unnamed protein product [Paramecium sonneborni]|uniref:Uncharacterized protein n=1 Tax=Paramecium sonneborni TaxID=65129 RepID=A0A8S1Q3C8_9CILI|nr:unnamed protein product [Paramecium sonneborni]